MRRSTQNSRPTHQPISTRMTTHRIKVLIGLIWKSAPVIPPPASASLKLTQPNTPPRIAPAVGPMVIAPTAIGTVRNDMYSGPTGTLPRPISFITTSIAASSASCARYRTLVVLLFICNSSCCRPDRVQRNLCLVSEICSLPHLNFPDFSSKSGADRRAQGFHRTRTGYADRE